MTPDVCRIEVPLCECVKGARELSTVFQIPSKYRTEGSATGAMVGTAYGLFVIRCDYCGTVLKCIEGNSFVKTLEIHESQEKR